MVGPGQMPNSHMQMQSGPGQMNGLGQKNDSSPMGQSDHGQTGMNQSRMPNSQYSQGAIQSGASMPYGPTSSQYGPVAPGQQGYQHSYPPTSAPGMTAGGQQKSGGRSKTG